MSRPFCFRMCRAASWQHPDMPLKPRLTRASVSRSRPMSDIMSILQNKLCIVVADDAIQHALHQCRSRKLSGQLEWYLFEQPEIRILHFSRQWISRAGQIQERLDRSVPERPDQG